MRGVRLGQFISQRRKALQLTQEELAKRISVSKSAVAKWETDGGLPDRVNIKKLASVLNVSVEDLYRVMYQSESRRPEHKINITDEVIATLEAYGYKVISPNEDEGEKKQ